MKYKKTFFIFTILVFFSGCGYTPIFSKKDANFKNQINGFVFIGDPKILETICNGIYIKVKNQGICMIGTKK